MSPRNKLARLALCLGAGLFSAGSGLAETVKPVTDPKVNSPKEDLRTKIFKEAPGKAACASVKTDPRGSTGGLDAELDGFLHLAIDALKSKNDKGLQPLFHKRLNVGLPAIAETFAKLDAVYGSPFDITVYRLWALNTVDGNPAGLTCDDDRLTVFPQYGYPLQFGVWLQIMGQKELGRIYLSIVPAEGRWNIGAFHAQQWTHNAKDFATWAEEATKTSRMGFKEAAFVKYDIAIKLLEGGGFINIAMRDDLIKARDAMMKPADWEKAIRETLKDRDIAYTSSLLVVDGGGILLRMRTPKELALDAMKEDCKKVGETILKQPWSSQLEGLRCSYILPNEDAKVDGAMGGMYMAFADLQPKDKG